MLTIESDQFFEAVKAGNTIKVRELIDRNPALLSAKSKSGSTGILFALYTGHTEIAGLIAQQKKELDIFEAACLGELLQVERLIKRDMDLANSYSDEGFTALQLAAYLGQGEAVGFLLKNGAEVNAVARNPTGYTALSGAVARGHLNVARILLEEGANPNHRYEGGFTPLMEAAASGKLEMTKLLLRHGADTQVRKDGKTARDYALEKGQSEVAELLGQQEEKTTS